LSGFAVLDQAQHEASDATELAVDTASRLDHFFDAQLTVLRANVTRLGEGSGSGERWKELTQHWPELAGARMFLVATSDGTGVKIVPLDGTGLSEAAAGNFRIEALEGLVRDALKVGAALSEGLIDDGSSQQFVAAAVSAGKDRVLVVATPRFTL